MAEVKLGEAYIAIKANAAPLKRDLVKIRTLTSRAMSSIGRLASKTLTTSFKIARKALTSLIRSLKRMAIVAATAFVGLSVAIIKIGMDAQESENLFKESMGGMEVAARKWSNTLAESLSLYNIEVRKNISVMNVMLKSMGIGEKKAFGMSKSLTKLAFDMASFFNIKPAEAFQKLQAGITGETEPLKRLGILINETRIKTYALTTGMIEEGDVLTENQKILARYNLIMESTRQAQGDLKRTGGSLTNVFRAIKSELQTLASRIFPSMEDSVTGLATAFKDWLKENRESIIKWSSIVIEKIELNINKFIEWIDYLDGDWKKGISEAFDFIIEKLKMIYNKVKPYAIKIGKAIGEGIIEGIQSTEVYRTLQQLPQGIMDQWQFKEEKRFLKRPARLLKQAADWLPDPPTFGSLAPVSGVTMQQGKMIKEMEQQTRLLEKIDRNLDPGPARYQ